MLGELEGTCEMMMPDDDQHCLQLPCVGRGAAGLLTCEVSNRHGTAHCTLRLCLAGRCPCTGGRVPLLGGGITLWCSKPIWWGGAYCPEGWHCSVVPHAHVPWGHCPIA